MFILLIGTSLLNDKSLWTVPQKYPKCIFFSFNQRDEQGSSVTCIYQMLSHDWKTCTFRINIYYKNMKQGFGVFTVT